MQKLIEGLLALTRLQSGTQRTPPARVHIEPLLRSVCEEAEVLSGFHPKLTLQIDSPFDLSGDEHELRSAFSNLVVNAMKYTPDEGEVTVRWIGDERGARLEVSDTGPGIAAEHLPRVTERFYRVEVDGCRNKSGSGLGLAIVKHVLNRHDASLEIDSVAGMGSRFACCFPEKRVIGVTSQPAPLAPTMTLESPQEGESSQEIKDL
jgi:two-component system phosphate regulon sensor histidine kinase PhoR